MINPEQANAVQPIGIHIRLSEDWVVRSISANASDLLGAAPTDLIDAPITGLFDADTVHGIRNRIALLRDDLATGHVLHCQFDRSRDWHDLTVGRAGGGYAIDAEPSPGQPFGDSTGVVHGMAATLDRCGDGQAVRDMAVRQIRGLTGFDEVTIDPAPGRTMMVVDRIAAAIGLIGADDDIGRSMLRVATAAEANRLAAAGARAALVLPLDGPDGPIGQIVCTHRSPRHVGVERRSVATLFARFVALRLLVADRA